MRVSRLFDNGAISFLDFYRNETIADGMQRQHRDRHLAVVGNVIAQVSQSTRIGGNSRGVIQRREVRFQA